MIFALFTPLFLSFFLTIDAEVKYTNSTSMDEGRYKLWWTFINATDTFHFKVEVEANGWIGFGITQLEYGGDWMRNGMDTYDVLVAGVYGNGSMYGLDYLLINQNRSQYPDHANIGSSEWVITSAREEGTKTTLEFNRKRLTSKALDTHVRPRKGYIQITPGLRNFVWAYHNTIDRRELNDISYKHNKSGLEPVVLIPREEQEPMYIEAAPAKRGTANAPFNTLVILFLPFLLVVLCEIR